MGRRIRVRAVTDIASARELREALAEVELRAWYIERRLGEGVRGLFSLENLLPGGLGGGVIGSLLGRLFHRS